MNLADKTVLNILARSSEAFLLMILSIVMVRYFPKDEYGTFLQIMLVANTYELEQNFLHRYPTLNAHKFTTITNGFEDYASPHEDKNDVLTLTHAGTLLFRSPQFLLQATVNLIERKIIPKEEIRIVLLGGDSIYSAQDQALESLLQHPLLKNVVEILPRLPYQDVTQYLSNSDMLFIIQMDYPLQVPRKLYEYMAFRKPILAITTPGGATARLIQENNLGIVVENQTSDLEAVLQNVYETWKNNAFSLLPINTYNKFMNKNLTLELLKVFRTCSGI